MEMTVNRSWKDFEGASLAGRYWLRQCLSETSDGAWYLTRTLEDAVVRVLSADAPFAEEALQMWREAIGFRHPNVVRMLDAGRTEVEGQELVFAVCESPDDFLYTVLEERPLKPDEASEVLRAALGALSFLHGRGLAHGAVDPTQIMAFGDRIKLPSYTIRRAGQPAPPGDPGPHLAPEVAAGAPATPAADMWSLGITLYQVLTRELPKLDREDEFLYLPQPFCGIVRHTLRRDPAERWAVDDVERHLNPPAPAPPPPAPAPQPVAATPPQMPMPLAMTPAEPEPPRAAPPISERLVLERPLSGPPIAEPPMPEPVAETPTLPPPTRPTRWEPPIDRGFPIKWAPAIGLVAAIALSAILFRHPSQPKAAPATAQPPAVQQPSKPAPPPAPISATARPAASAPEPATAESSTPSAMPSTGARIWRVVAYTYGNRKSAESMARKLNEKHTGMRAEVFAPSGERYPYYVALGGRMTLAQAQAVQKQARSKGLPRDTFVRNFSN